MMHEQNQIYQYIKDGKFEDALKALFENIEENPNAVENYINAGIVLSDAGEIEKAERFFQKAITLDPVQLKGVGLHLLQIQFEHLMEQHLKIDEITMYLP